MFLKSIVPTIALAHNSSPPIGAKIMPMAKKIGITVFGVRIGLATISDRGEMVGASIRTYCHAFNRCCLKAVSVQQVTC